MQESCRQVWCGNPANTAAAQEAFLERVAACGAAAQASPAL